MQGRPDDGAVPDSSTGELKHNVVALAKAARPHQDGLASTPHNISSPLRFSGCNFAGRLLNSGRNVVRFGNVE
jgi:hypothetical protein